MRQAVEAQVLSPHCELGEQGLRQILTDVIEEVRQSVNQDIDGAEILHSLLNAAWLQSLLKVYECLQRFLIKSPAPALDYASGLSLQLLIDIRALPGCSADAKELYRLLRQPHVQALLSAHDTVAQKDYDPVLPPMPEDLPDDEEATRIVCLVKNKQPLRVRRLPLPGASSSSSKPSRMRSHWDTLRRLTLHRLHHGGAFRVQGPAGAGGARRGSFPPAELLCPAAAQSFPPPRCDEPISSCRPCCSRPMSRCRGCYSDLLWEETLSRPAPSVSNSFVFDDIVEELDPGVEDDEEASPLPPTSRRWTLSPPCLAVPSYSYLHPDLPPRGQRPRIHTAPPSPLRPHRVLDLPPVELAKQESLDELRSTVQLAASSMETSTKDIKLLGEKMAAATERMSDTVQDNSQALVLLTQVVDRLQTLLASSPKPGPPASASASPAPQSRGQRPSLTHQSRCSLPSTSSSSFNSSLDAPSASQGTSCLSVSCHGSPRPTLKTRDAPPLQQKNKHSGAGLTNGVEEASPTGRRRRSNQRKKRKKKVA